MLIFAQILLLKCHFEVAVLALLHRNIFVASILLVVLVISACTPVSRGIGTITANKYAALRSGSLWVVAPPELEPLSATQKTVYVSYRDLSDTGMADLTSIVEQTALDRGWLISADPSTASVRLRASLRYFGEVAPESGGATVASDLGAIAGTAVGLATYDLAGRSASAVVGALSTASSSGNFIKAGLENASSPREWAAVIDFVIEEYSAEPISFSYTSDTGRNTTADGGAASARNSLSGGQFRRNTSAAQLQKQSHYYPHGARLSVWANQMNLKEPAATAAIQAKLQRIVGAVLPQ